MSQRYVIGNLVITTPDEWMDVTAEMGDKAPFTLAKRDGVGALQFSSAEYRKGLKPQIGTDELKHLLRDFALSRELGKGFDESIQQRSLLVCGCSFSSTSQFVRVWYCSNGQDVVLATYVCATEDKSSELAECENIIAGMQLKPC